MDTEILNAVDAPTEEQIKEYAMGNNDREDQMRHYANIYKKYLNATDLMNGLLSNTYLLHKDGMFGDLGQKIIVSIISELGCEVNYLMPDISRRYVSLLHCLLRRCPFRKEQALEWAKEATAETSEPTKRGIWGWIKGLFR